MTIDIYKPTLRAEYGGDIKKAIAGGAYTVWTPERIKGAFAFGTGTMADFERYKRNNANLMIFLEV